MKLIELFERQVSERAEQVAVVDAESSLTYRELDERAARLADGLRVGPGCAVLVGARRGIDGVVAQLAVLKAGGVYVPVDPEAPAERLKMIARRTGAVASVGVDVEC